MAFEARLVDGTNSIHYPFIEARVFTPDRVIVPNTCRFIYSFNNLSSVPNVCHALLKVLEFQQRTRQTNLSSSESLHSDWEVGHKLYKHCNLVMEKRQADRMEKWGQDYFR